MFVYNNTNRQQQLTTKNKKVLSTIKPHELTSIESYGKYISFTDDVNFLGNIPNYVIVVKGRRTEIVFKPMTKKELREYLAEKTPYKKISPFDWIYNSDFQLYYSPRFAMLLIDDPDLLKKYWLLTKTF